MYVSDTTLILLAGNQHPSQYTLLGDGITCDYR